MDASDRNEPNRSTAHDVVVAFSWADTWGDACAREMCMSGDRLLVTLLRHEMVNRLLVANPYRSWPIRQARRLVGQRPAPFRPVRPGQELVSPMRVRRAPPDRTSAVRSLYAAYDRRLRKAAEGMGMSAPAVITVNPFVAAFAPLDWAASVTYYALDDWTAHPRHRRLWPALADANEEIRRRDRQVCAVSQALLDRIAPAGPSLVVANGVEPNEWSGPVTPPTWFAGLRGPRILYVGTIDSRIDVDVLTDLADRYPAATVVLVGLVTEAEAVAPLRALPNVHIEPPAGRSDVAALIRSADVCILPHHRSPLTETMSPLKFYEYLSGGRPVVATDLAPIRGIHPRAVLIPPGASFAEAVATALATPPVPEADRLAFVDTHAWARSHDAILGLALGTGGAEPRRRAQHA